MIQNNSPLLDLPVPLGVYFSPERREMHMRQVRPLGKARKQRRSVSISRIMAFTFLGIIVLGAFLLTLPAASRTGRSHGVLTALFTATSATCVTGLVMGDTYSMWSPFGQGVILLMIQVGGLGFMSAASLAYFTLRKKIGMRSRLVMAEAIGASSMSDITDHQRKLMIRAFTVEGIGAAVLTARFAFEFPFPQALKLGVFHSISAFCNAGFDILGFKAPGTSLMLYHTDPVICLTLTALVVLGGLGFLVWDEVLREHRPSRWSVYTKLVIITTGILLCTGIVLTCLLEWNNPKTLGPLSLGEKLLAALFQSMTLRTAGFAGLDQALLTPASKAVSVFLMLIGGSSGSTAGGLKTVTLVVLIMFLWNRIRGRYTVSVFHRTISDDHVLNAITIFFLMWSLSFFGGVFICATSAVSFADGLYEAVSAIGTVGLTTGITPALRPAAKIMIILFMYFGRVGVLTISFGFLKKKPAGERFKYANTDLLIG
ncbi:MAG: potassium uptake protein, TrkH family [Clostridia bacterium]|nr:potassium uptake protein, TrkH family [Clostridia bacterium]